MSLRKRIAALVGLFGVILIAVIAGESLGAQYALIQEAQLEGIVLAMNGAIFSRCKTRGCEGFSQQQLVAENDIVLQQHQILERAYRNPASRLFYYTTMPVLTVIAADTSDELSSIHRALRVYKRLGCGLNGVICRQEAASSGKTSRKNPGDGLDQLGRRLR